MIRAAPYTEPNGEDCYWSSGNGWVFGAHVRVLDVLPTSDPHRDEYIQTFKEMADALRQVQRSDGFWNVSLHDPGNYGGKEPSSAQPITYDRVPNFEDFCTGIFLFAGSEVYKMADQGEETPTPENNLGDVNNDGIVNIIDALLTVQFYVGLNPDNFQQEQTDVNCDDSVDIIDTLLIAQFYVGLITEFC